MLFLRCLQEAYKAYEQHFKDSPPAVLRDCLELVSGLDPISIDEVGTLSRLRRLRHRCIACSRQAVGLCYLH